MNKIRALTVKDRSVIYEMMQEENILKQSEIDSALEQIDNFLFEKNKNSINVVVFENQENKIIGFISYCPSCKEENTVIIYKFLISSLYNIKEVALEFLDHIEKIFSKKDVLKIIFSKKECENEKYKNDLFTRMTAQQPK